MSDPLAPWMLILLSALRPSPFPTWETPATADTFQEQLLPLCDTGERRWVGRVPLHSQSPPATPRSAALLSLWEGITSAEQRAYWVSDLRRHACH